MNTTTTERTCPCGTTYCPNSNAQTYCSVRCRDKHHRDRCRNEGRCYQCGGDAIPKGNKCQACIERHRNDSVVSNRRLREEVLKAYGGCCACCGTSTFEFLAIDHIDGGGNQHRTKIGSTNAVHFCRWLKRNGFPSGFRVLCHNCNMARGFYGHCPHEKEN